MRPASVARPALLAALLLAALAPAQTEAQTATPGTKELCLGRAATPDQRMAGCTALIDAKTETGRTLAVLMRPARRRTSASPASLRLALEPAPDGLDLWVLKSRGRGPVRVRDVLGA